MHHHTVEVAVLGPVAVRGAAEPFHRSAALELVVYLAFHPGGVRQAEWALAIWPSGPWRRPRCTRPRPTPGAPWAGPRTVPPSSRGRDLRLHDSVTTDVDRFESLAASEDPARLSEAMRLVRGPLFGGLHRADWAVFDGIGPWIESLVVRTALRGADGWIGRGLRERGGMDDPPSPQSEPLRRAPLPRALLRATAAQGNRVGLRSTMAELLTLAGEPEGAAAASPQVGKPEGAPLDSLHPETTNLYRALRDGRPVAEGQPARL